MPVERTILGGPRPPQGTGAPRLRPVNEGIEARKEETGEGAILKKTEDVDANMKFTTYKRPGDAKTKPASKKSSQGPLKCKPENNPYQDIPEKRSFMVRQLPHKTDDREITQCGKIGM